jgi:hypothetical protein
VTDYGYTTLFTTSQSTDDCIVEGTEIHISTNTTVLVETLRINDTILTKDGPFNIDDETSLFSISTTIMAGALSSDDYLSGARKTQVIGIVDINNGLLKTTGGHLHIIKRGGFWIVSRGMHLVVGDILNHITNGETPITSIVHDETNTYTVYKLDVEPNDVFFANGILTHNRKGEGEVLCPPVNFKERQNAYLQRCIGITGNPDGCMECWEGGGMQNPF